MKKIIAITAALLFVGSSWSLAQQSAQPPGGMDELSAYSLFLENYKNDSYESAIRYGSWIWKNMPQTLKGYNKFDLEKNLERLVSCYSGAAENAQDPSLKEAYVDTALIIYDKVFDNFSEDQIDYYSWHLRKGRFYQTHSGIIDNATEKAGGEYRKSFELNPEELIALGDGYYVRVIIQGLMSAGKKDEALSIIDEAEPHAGPQLKEYFTEARNDLFDTPEERIAFLKDRLKEDPENIELLQQLRDLYEDQDMKNELMEINRKLYEIDPSYEHTTTLAEAAISNAEYDRAIRYLKEAIDKTDDNRQKAELSVKISNAYKNKDQLQEARRFARQAARLASDWGQPLIQIADIYAQAVNQCTSGRKMEREDRAVYWLVLDYLDKARSTDSSVANNVKRKYDTYQPVVPSTEDKFFKGWEEGDKFSVDSSIDSCYGWINETTTIR